MGSVVVVGGGIAGLACAWRLRRTGHDVEVLERAAEPGGRMRTDQRDGFTIDVGAQFVASGYRNLHSVATTLGIERCVRPLANERNAVLRAGALHPGDYASPLSLLRSPLLSPGARLRLARLGLELARRWRDLDPLHPESAAAHDRESLSEGITRLAGEEVLEYVVGPAFSSTFDAEPEDLSLAFALLALRFLAGGFRLQSFEGGVGLVTRTLAEHVTVRLGCDVTDIESETSGARVRYRRGGRDGSVVADAVVVAVPGCEVARLCPKLTPEERGFFERVRYGRGAIVHLMLDREPPTLPYYGVSFPRREGLDLYGLAVDHHKAGAAPPGAGLLNAALTAQAAERLWEAPDAALAKLVVENLARTPVGRLSPVGHVVHRWSPMLPLFEAGHLWRLSRFLGRIERSPRMAFAGDYLVGPYSEAALASGTRAATEIAREL